MNALQKRFYERAASWSAPAKRSDDGAFRGTGQFDHRGCFQSGVALRLPPHSKTLREVQLSRQF